MPVVLPPFDVARLLVRFDHVARIIVNANHRFRCPAEKLAQSHVSSGWCTRADQKAAHRKSTRHRDHLYPGKDLVSVHRVRVTPMDWVAALALGAALVSVCISPCMALASPLRLVLE